MESRSAREESTPFFATSFASDVPYLRSNIYRFNVPDEKVGWSVPFPEYDPPDHTDPKAVGKSWSDPDPQAADNIRWNAIDGKINRKSFICDYSFDSMSRPMNPMGRTGLRGRGLLGRWGPNHAADPLVTRIKDGKLQFVAIKRSDTGEWALPGGMVDAGEEVSQTLKREFSEEALGGKAADDAVHAKWISVDSKEPLYATHEEFVALLKSVHGIQ
ncbi:hydrolase, NUDIX family [Teladorsagia circumcincta]|uniref:Hydrolase, NUDIX family n=1 Tax=Teladorsagia circumcincta TaxID=45464 RepID=A0A2G9U341_TELCI|nr:hydrolase, NUDIX family [Teladorsagia circumcincta]